MEHIVQPTTGADDLSFNLKSSRNFFPETIVRIVIICSLGTIFHFLFGPHTFNALAHSS